MQKSQSSTLLVTTDNYIKTIAFNQPKKKNAISNEMAHQLKDVILESKDDDSRVIILTGTGENFSAGADLDPSIFNGVPFDVTDFLRTVYNPMVLAMREMNKPIIAKVRGKCVGAAFSFALGCDMIYASDTAVFSQIFTRIGLSSDGGGAYFLPQRIGYQKAFELMATNAMISAEEAAQLGIANHVLADNELDEAVNEMANRLANGPYLAIQHTKSNIQAGLNGSLADALEQEAINQGLNFQSKDFIEGVMAFLQKRKANFKGN